MDKAFRILLIEDDRYISGFTAVSLRKEGYEVDVAQSADEGLFLYASQHPDIVLLDLGLPTGTVWRCFRSCAKNRICPYWWFQRAVRSVKRWPRWMPALMITSLSPFLWAS